MKSASASYSVLSRFLLLFCVAAFPSHSQNAAKLSQVKTLYVDSLGQEKGATETRSQLIRRLEKTHDLQVTQNSSGADAVVKGTAQIWVTGRISPSPRAHVISEPTYGGYLSIEVIGQGGQTLWSYLVTPSKFPLGSISDDLAGQLVSRLLRDRREKNQPAPLVAGAAAQAHAALKGAGATFPAPLYQKWFQSFEELHPDVATHYDAVGSEARIESVSSGSTDFGASDMPLSDEMMTHASRRFVQIPTAVGAVVPIYNLPHLSGEIRFTPETLAGIYLGKIKKWNNPQIQAANRGADLPDADIVVVHRSDPSGTTYVWSDFLSKVSHDWSIVNHGLTAHWPVGIGAAYNEGVATAVQQTPNSIGHVEFIYAIQHELNFASVKNAEGRYVRASIASVTAAVQASSAPDRDLRISITNAPSGASYPIASYTWLVAPAEIQDPGKRTALLDLLRWMLTSGQKSSSALGYAPLPPEIARRALDSLSSIK